MTETPQPGAQPGGPQKPTAEQWAAQFQQTYGREPSMNEYQNALASGHIDTKQDSPKQQFSEGARQMAAGARDFYQGQVAPRAQSFQQSVGQQVRQRPGLTKWAPVIVPGVALFAILMLFLPVASFMGISANYFEGDGMLILFLMLAVIGVAVAAQLKPTRGLFQAMSITAMVAGSLSAIIALVGIFRVLGADGISAGPGTFVTFLLTAVVAAFGFVVFSHLRGGGMPVSLLQLGPTGGQPGGQPSGGQPQAQGWGQPQPGQPQPGQPQAQGWDQPGQPQPGQPQAQGWDQPGQPQPGQSQVQGWGQPGQPQAQGWGQPQPGQPQPGQPQAGQPAQPGQPPSQGWAQPQTPGQPQPGQPQPWSQPQQPAQQSGQQPAQQSGQQPAQQSGQQPAQQSGQQPAQQSGQQSGLEAPTQVAPWSQPGSRPGQSQAGKPEPGGLDPSGQS